MNYFELIQNKIYTDKSDVQLQRKLSFLRFKSKKIVFTNGCFDILHLGHIEYLAKAASKGDAFVLGLNSDASVRRLKGNKRPIQDEKARATTLAALQFVDLVVLFDEDTPVELIHIIQPDVLIKGADYRIDEIAGAEIVKAKGGIVETVELTSGYSTTTIIEKIKNL